MRAKITDFLEFTVTPKNITDWQKCVAFRKSGKGAKTLHPTACPLSPAPQEEAAASTHAASGMEI